MRLKCPECGQTHKFKATQYVSGTASVYVDAGGEFHSNVGENGYLDTGDLDCGKPDGPYLCWSCEGDVVAVDVPETPIGGAHRYDFPKNSRDRVKELEAALKPFSELLEDPDNYEPDEEDGTARLWVDPRDITKAQEVLRKNQEESS